MLRALVIAAVAVTTTGPCGGDPERVPGPCTSSPYFPIHATSGSLVVQPAREDLACPDVACSRVCTFESGAEGDDLGLCRPAFREEETPVPDGTFVVAGDAPLESGASRRLVRITSASPAVAFSFELPDVRSLDGEHAWSSPILEPVFGSGSCTPNAPPDALVAGRLRVLSRTGGADADAIVTDDYHAVVEVSGRFEAVPGSDRGVACTVLPATEFSFTYEEGEVSEVTLCTH